VLSFNTESSWLLNYFTSLGAVSAKNFRIHTAAIANAQATYDSLMTYDLIFIKGGNQANYYLTWKNTKTSDAITDKFNSGGVISGTSAGLHILSGVVFTAENGLAYPDDCLKNIFHNRIVLKNDFLDLMPGYIFDSHFVERGRLARMLAFMARWNHDHNELITGIGVDDMTAFCIDATNPDEIIGAAWGTAAVNIYQGGQLGHQSNKLYAKDVNAIQLLHGHSINLNTYESTGFGQQMNVAITQEFVSYPVILSGSDPLAENQQFVSYLVDSVLQPSNPVLIITGTNTDHANTYRQALMSAGISTVNVSQALPANQTNTELQQWIQQAHLIIFVRNSYQTLYDFVNSGSGNGQLLHEKINTYGAAFIGDNSRFAGAYAVSDNYLTNPSASFHGQLNFNPGLNLLKTMVIMPNTYLYDTDFFENTTSAIPWAMLDKQVQRGVWLTVRNFMIYEAQGLDRVITVYGESPAMILTAQEGGYDLNAHLFRNRQVGGFEYMDFQTLLFPEYLKVGEGVYGLGQPLQSQSLSAAWDAASRTISVFYDAKTSANSRIQLYSVSGQLILSESLHLNANTQVHRIRTPQLPNGLYLLSLQNNDGLFRAKLVLGE
jgi:cyanophycinase-like exopeptidase